MAKTVSVRLELDSAGAIDRIESAGQEFEQLAESEDEAAKAAERYDEAASDSAQAAEQQAQANQDAAQAAERSSQAQREAAQSAQRYAAATDRVASSSGNASQVIFSTGDAIQDVQFGMAGAANNIAFVAESFAEMQQQAGGARAALSGVFAALKGPAGIILGLQALLALGPQIADFFQSWIEGAEETTEKQKELKEETRGTVEAFLDRLRDDPKQAAAAIDVLTTAIDELEQQTAEAFRQGATDSIKDTSDTLKTLRATLEAVRGRSQETEEAFLALTELGIPPQTAEKLIDIANASSEAEEETRDLVSASELLQRAVRQMSSLPDDALVPQNIPDLNQELNLPALASDLQDVQDLLGAGMLNSVGSVTAALGSLDRMFNQATSDQKRRQIEELRQVLRGMREDMSDLEQKTVQVGQMLEGFLASAVDELTTALIEGENPMIAFAQLIGQLFQRMGKAFIAAGVAQRSIGVPGAAIASGAALVTAGAAIQSIAGGVGSGSSGSPRRGGSTTGSGNSLATGGEVERGLDVPGRRRGGPVRGGQVYRTHGLGNREFFVPNTDGEIMTQGALNATAPTRSPSSQRVNVQTENNLNVDVSEPDLFELRAQLNEIENEVSQLR